MTHCAKFFIGSLLIFIVCSSFCQGSGRAGKGSANSVSGEIFGNIIDSIERIPLGYITIRVFSTEDQKLVGGAVSEENGHFSLTGLPLGSYYLDFSFIGYKTKTIENVVLNEFDATNHLKNVLLEPFLLDEVEISGNTPMLSYEIDKKIIHVEDQINTEGQTAIEILENIPSITISPEGTVSLRGSSSFTLLIDGVPTIMDAGDYLASLPASSVKEIEVITNPATAW